MAKGEISNITDVQSVANNFKTKENLKNFKGKSGMNMSGKDKLFPIYKNGSRKAETGSKKFQTLQRSERV